MSEENKNVTSDILARLRGVGTGGVQAPQQQSQTQSQPQPQMQQAVGTVGQEQQEKPKRDIQELYDFIDAYCSDE